jgi:hypothetical protein
MHDCHEMFFALSGARTKGLNYYIEAPYINSAMPLSRFDKARNFLASWWQKLSKRGAPLPSIFTGRQDSLL